MEIIDGGGYADLMAKKAASSMLSVVDAAGAVGVSGRQIRNMIAAGRLPATKVGNSYVIQRADLDAVPRDRKRGPKPQPRTR